MSPSDSGAPTAPEATSIDLWIIAGFLGSGKTSVLNALLEDREDRRIGVVVNDFGSLNVDTTLIPDRDEPVVELNGGQIFCSCLSGSFVRSLTDLAAQPVEAILVESSGLAKPRPMAEIIGEAEKRTDGRLRYRGMIGVVDAERIEKLRAAVNAVDEQLLYSNLIVINKCDLVDEDQLLAVSRSLAELCPEVTILNTTHGTLTWDSLPGNESPAADAAAGKTGTGGVTASGREYIDLTRFTGWGESGRPVARTILVRPSATRSDIQEIVTRLCRVAYRVKGYAVTDSGSWFVSASGEQLEIRSVESGERHVSALSVIVPASVALDELVQDFSLHAAIAEAGT